MPCILTKVTATAQASNRLKHFGDQIFCSMIVVTFLLSAENVVCMCKAYILQSVLLTAELLFFQLLCPISSFHPAFFPVVLLISHVFLGIFP